MNVAFLMKSVSGYFAACLGSLARLEDINVLVICKEPSPKAPYDITEITPDGAQTQTYRSLPDGQTIATLLREFEVDVVAVSGWRIQAFRFALRKLSSDTLRVLLMDNQWIGTFKQRCGVIIAPRYILSQYDIAFLPGHNQEIFAKKLGFRNHQIWRGLYSCDYERFANHTGPQIVRDNSFLFVGRLAEEKGIGTLAKAYAAYRQESKHPWRLNVYGTGPEGGQLQQMPGVRMNGFVQPRKLPQIYRRGGCFILPSLFEPWGVVIHEATASGLPVICSATCGAAPHLVEDGVNGYLVEPANASELAEAMHRYSSLGRAEQERMSQMSSILASRYTPTRWATLFDQRARETIRRRTLKRFA